MSTSSASGTSLALLDQLAEESSKESHHDRWQRLVDLYAPLLDNWLRQYEVQDADREDLIQDVLMVIMRELPSFRHSQRIGAFRTWLRRILVNRLQNFWRQRGRNISAGNSADQDDFARRLQELEAPQSELAARWDLEHNQHVVRRLLKLVEPKFSVTTQQLFRRLALDGASASDVAAEFELTLGAVFTAKSRVLRELRRLGKGMID